MREGQVSAPAPSGQSILTPFSTGDSSLAKSAAHLFAHFLDLADVGEGAAPDARGLRHEMAVRRGTDADGEEPRVTELGANQLEELVLVADLSVGEKDDLPDALAAFRAGRARD